MATIINTPGNGSNDSGAAAGWTVAVVAIILLALVGLFVWNAERAPSDGTANEPAPQAAQGGYNAGQEPPVVNNFTTINASSTINNSTTTSR